MSKEKEKKTARRMYVELNMTGKEIAEELAVTEKTVSRWVNEFGWAAERNARAISATHQTENIKAIMAQLASERLELSARLKKDGVDKPEEIRQQLAKIDDAISKWNKTLTNIDKENRLSLSVYISVMEEIFGALLMHDPALHARTIDFQETHLKNIRLKLK